MKLKYITFGILFFYTINKMNAQDFFIVAKDTTFCSNLKFVTNLFGTLNFISYTDINGQDIEINGKENVPMVMTFHIGRDFIDLIPLKAEKPEGFLRYTQRAINGKLIVYLSEQGGHEIDSYAPPEISSWHAVGDNAGTNRFILKMPDGAYYTIKSKKNMKKYIIPYLLECEKFQKEYKDKFRRKERPFMTMIWKYNTMCE